MPKYWSDAGSHASEDWYGIDFGAQKLIHSVKLYFYGDGTQFTAPASYTLQSWNGAGWAEIPNAQKAPVAPLANGENTITFAPTSISRLRVVFPSHANTATALVQIKVF
jgi:hypothetical protein